MILYGFVQVYASNTNFGNCGCVKKQKQKQKNCTERFYEIGINGSVICVCAVYISFKITTEVRVFFYEFVCLFFGTNASYVLFLTACLATQEITLFQHK